MNKEEQYFDNKLDEILGIMSLILSRMQDEKDVARLRGSLKIKLKEVARDQRDACLEVVQGYYEPTGGMDDLVQNLIQNAQIDKE